MHLNTLGNITKKETRKRDSHPCDLKVGESFGDE
jgi:hypothetical protein